ncbi:MAG: hypothetical protein ACN4E2_07480 [Nitrospinota bacterium]
MRNLIIYMTILLLSTSTAYALPGSSVYPKPDNKIWTKVSGRTHGPVPCAACHTSSKQYEKNIYIDIRDAKGRSMVSKGIANIPYKPGKTATIQVVVGLRKQDKSAKVAGWFFNLPQDSSLAKGSVNYCYQAINYPGGSLFAVDKREYRTSSTHYITFDKYFEPSSTLLWVGIGSKATEMADGSADERKGTLGLASMKVNWILDDM